MSVASGDPETPYVRQAARVLLLDADNRVLLFRVVLTPPQSVDGYRAFWLTPGGGIEPGETPEEAARRELYEETGIEAPLGPCVWTRVYRGRLDGRPWVQHERYYIARTTVAEVVRDGWTPEEHRDLAGHRWWALDEIAAATDQVFVPGRLAALAAALLAGDIPATPIDAGL